MRPSSAFGRPLPVSVNAAMPGKFVNVLKIVWKSVQSHKVGRHLVDAQSSSMERITRRPHLLNLPQPHAPLYIGMLFSHCFPLLLSCLLLIPNVDSLHFVTFNACEMSSIKN